MTLHLADNDWMCMENEFSDINKNKLVDVFVRVYIGNDDPGNVNMSQYSCSFAKYNPDLFHIC